MVNVICSRAMPTGFWVISGTRKNFSSRGRELLSEVGFMDRIYSFNASPSPSATTCRLKNTSISRKISRGWLTAFTVKLSATLSL